MTVALVGMICAMSMMPGTSTTVILDTTWSYGRRLGFLAALGGSIGVAIYTGLAFVAGAYLTERGIWVNILEGVGALYLAVLGVTALVEAFTLRLPDHHGRTSALSVRVLLAGLISTCTSPKIAVFYLIILAQYDFGSLPVLHGILLAGLIHICFRLIWYGTWIHLIHPVRQAFQTLWLQRLMKLTTAVFMLGLSIHVMVGVVYG